MTTGPLQDRRRFAQSQLEAMANQPSAEHPDALRQIAASVLGFTPVSDAIIAVDHAQLPPTATVVGSLANEFGPDYLAVHFDLSALTNASRREYVTLAQVQAANDVVQRYAGEERYPLLIFTLPDNSGVQFVTGDPAPGNRYRLQDVIRVAAYWGSANRTALDCLERVGNDIAAAGVPRRAFRNGFNVQPVTDAFFADYKAAYDEAVKLIAAGIGQSDAEQFTQTLFNRLLFIHFVSRKGWLRFKGSADYLNALWRDYQDDAGETNFYLCRLSHVFFAGLNNPQSMNLIQNNPALHSAIGDVPFLNGGLFEQNGLDQQAANGVFAVPDDVVVPLLGNGSAPGLFNRYNFTVMEATPLDTEVAVDPEMLGKLFEETVNERHSNGAYYTPRPVVAFMCREAIKGYLAGQDIADLTDDKIAHLVDNADPQAVTVAQALEVANAVAGLKAVDPACGSGAFLLGMLQEIVALNDTLFRAGHTPESLYQQKLDIISNNIYGVDQDGLAVSTAMLRLWLSLAVDFDGDGAPAPLPNLDLKLVDGDAIAGPDPQQLDFTLQSIVNSGLREDNTAYTTAHGQRKATLKQQVEATKQQLRDNMRGTAPAGVVEWRIDFADVMLNGGFDVVIANPPYVQLQRNGGELANLYRNAGYATFARTGDLYQLFHERGCQLLKPANGLLAYVTSNSWLRAEYGKATRRYFAERHTPLQLIELGKDVFDSAIVDSCVLIARTGKSDVVGRAVDLDKVAAPDFPPDAKQWGELRTDGESPWSVLTPVEQSVMDKMMAAGAPLQDWDVNLYRGFTTGCNDAFIIDSDTRRDLIKADAKSAEIIKPVLRGRDIRQYHAPSSGWHLIDTHNGYGDVPAVNVDDYPVVKDWLDGFYARLEKRQDKGKTPYNLRNCTYHDKFVGEKLFWMDMAPRGRFAYSNNETYCNNKAYIMTGESLKYLCAVLNSRLITWLVKNTGVTTGMGLTEWTVVTVGRILIPKVSTAKQRPLVRLVDRILAAKIAGLNADTRELEAEIDRLVYALYGLTDGEVAAVVGSV